MTNSKKIKTIKVEVEPEIWEAFFRVFPGIGERSTFLRSVICEAIQQAGEKERQIREVVRRSRERQEAPEGFAQTQEVVFQQSLLQLVESDKVAIVNDEIVKDVFGSGESFTDWCQAKGYRTRWDSEKYYWLVAEAEAKEGDLS